MALRWTGAAMLEAAKGFRRLKAHRQLPILKTRCGISAGMVVQTDHTRRRFAYGERKHFPRMDDAQRETAL